MEADMADSLSRETLCISLQFNPQNIYFTSTLSQANLNSGKIQINDMHFNIYLSSIYYPFISCSQEIHRLVKLIHKIGQCNKYNRTKVSQRNAEGHTVSLGHGDFRIGRLWMCGGHIN